jgi:hypothetical protein
MTARCVDCNMFLFFDERRNPMSPYERCECGGEIDRMVGSSKLFGSHPYYEGKTFTSESGDNYFYAYRDSKGHFFVFHDKKLHRLQTKPIDSK